MNELMEITLIPVNDFDLKYLEDEEYIYHNDILKHIDDMTDEEIEASKGKGYFVSFNCLTNWINEYVSNVGITEFIGDDASGKTDVLIPVCKWMAEKFIPKSEQHELKTLGKYLLESKAPSHVTEVIVWSYHTDHGGYNYDGEYDFDDWFEFEGVMDMNNVNLVKIGE